jgi:prephenate dehydrogenase
VRPNSLAVIGLGAIGGSLAWQARLSGVRRVVGHSLRSADGVEALKAGAITDLASSPAAAASGADLVILAVPPAAALDLMAPLASALGPPALLTDVCSVKQPIMKKAAEIGIGDRFAGSHPLAGTHETGFLSARPDRLRGCVVYVCAGQTPAGHRAAGAVASFWEHTLEASPVLIDPEAHDRQLAWTSHLPQAVAYAMAKALSDRGLGGVSFGSGARDTMRLALSDPELWLDILLLNRTAVCDALEHAQSGVAELQRLLSKDDRAGLLRYLKAAQNFRRGIER